MSVKKRLIQRRGRLQLAQYYFINNDERKLQYVVSYGASKFSVRNGIYMGRDIFVTDKVQDAIDNLIGRKQI